MFLRLSVHKDRPEQTFSTRYVCQLFEDRITFHDEGIVPLFSGEYWSILRALTTKNKVKFVDIEMDTPTVLLTQMGTSDQQEIPRSV